MKIANPDRRISARLNIKTPLRVRIWKSKNPEQRSESINLSHSGIYFSSNSSLRERETVEILLNMPEELTDEPTAEWRCTGHVVRVERSKSNGEKVGVGVQFDCYEIARARLNEAS